MELWSTTGWRGTSVAAIAERADVTDQGVLHHFGTKQNLLFEVAAEQESRNVARLAGRIALLNEAPCSVASRRRDVGRVMGRSPVQRRPWSTCRSFRPNRRYECPGASDVPVTSTEATIGAVPPGCYGLSGTYPGWRATI
jgi:AcrR family transcriptional regulator